MCSQGPGCVKRYRFYRNGNWANFFLRVCNGKTCKSCQLLFKIGRLCISSMPVVLRAGLNDQLRRMQLNKTTGNEESRRQWPIFRCETQTWWFSRKSSLCTRSEVDYNICYNAISGNTHEQVTRSDSKLKVACILGKPVIFFYLSSTGTLRVHPQKPCRFVFLCKGFCSYKVYKSFIVSHRCLSCVITNGGSALMVITEMEWKWVDVLIYTEKIEN